MAITRDCFEPAAASFVCCDGFAAAMEIAVAGERFLADFDIEILRSVMAALPPHHRNPAGAQRPAGQDLTSASWHPE